MSFGKISEQLARFGLVAFTLTAGFGCTQSSSRQFKLMPALDSAPAAFEVGQVVVEKRGAPVDILWVIDNSASMLSSQKKLKNGLAAFARDYLTKNGTDIQLAVITTDAFVANAAWEKYLVTENPKTGKTPLEVHREKAPDQRQWGSDYATLRSGDVMKTKGASKSTLLDRFQDRVLVGTQGIYEEQGLGSVQQFLSDNEAGPSKNKLFRKGSQRIIVFLSDENDQTVAPENIGPEPRKLLYSGSYYTGKDQAAANSILPAHFTIDCPSSVVDGVTLAPMTLCLRPGLVLGVDRFKNELDSFFRTLDGNPYASPNYFVTAIVAKDVATIEGLRKSTTEKNSETGMTVITHEAGSRYLDLVAAAGNGSFAMDIGAEDYSPILEKIGLEIEKRSVVRKTAPETTFTLDRLPDVRETLVVTVEMASGGTIALASNQYEINGRKLKIVDPRVVAALQPGDRVLVRYQPAEQVPSGSKK